jgi:uncharacterized membrane protein YdfJ with MMPL/SSD domain
VIVKSGCTIAELLREERAGARVATAVSAAYRSLVAGMRAIVESDGVDVTDAQAVRHAIRDDVWTDEGHAVRMVQSKTEPLSEADKREYDRVSKRISRLARDIVAAPKIAPQKTTVRVPKDVQAAIDALLANHDAKVIREALKRAAK